MEEVGQAGAVAKEVLQPPGPVPGKEALGLPDHLVLDGRVQDHLAHVHAGLLLADAGQLQVVDVVVADDEVGHALVHGKDLVQDGRGLLEGAGAAADELVLQQAGAGAEVTAQVQLLPEVVGEHREQGLHVHARGVAVKGPGEELPVQGAEALGGAAHEEQEHDGPLVQVQVVGSAQPVEQDLHTRFPGLGNPLLKCLPGPCQQLFQKLLPAGVGHGAGVGGHFLGLLPVVSRQVGDRPFAADGQEDPGLGFQGLDGLQVVLERGVLVLDGFQLQKAEIWFPRLLTESVHDLHGGLL